MDKAQHMNVMVPFILALCTALIHCLSSVAGRYFVSKGTLSAQQIVADSYAILSVVFFTIFINCTNPYPLSTILLIGGISIFSAVASFIFTEAIVYGKGGPAHALSEVQSLFVLILEILILGKFPNMMQIVGFSFGFVGGAFIAFESKREANLELNEEEKQHCK